MPKITLTYDNGLGDISTVEIESDNITHRDDVRDWLITTGMRGIGFNVEVQE